MPPEYGIWNKISIACSTISSRLVSPPAPCATLTAPEFDLQTGESTIDFFEVVFFNAILMEALVVVSSFQEMVMSNLDRRTFMRLSIERALALSALGGLPVLDLLALPAHAQSDRVKLAVRKGTDIPQLVSDTLRALGGMEQFVRRGETVVVKPNIGWDRSPETAANTNPMVVRAVVEHCLEAGARSVQVFDRSANDARRSYVNSGIEEAVNAIKSDRVRVEHMDRRAYRDLNIAKGVELTAWPFYMPAIEADRFINVPVAKHHGLSTLTLGLKNTMGVIGGNRGVLHRRLSESLADINTVVHSDLTIIDAVQILVANGPQGGRLEDVRRTDTLIASADIVAADAQACGLFGHKAQDIGMVVEAARRGLGTMDPARIEQV